MLVLPIWNSKGIIYGIHNRKVLLSQENPVRIGIHTHIQTYKHKKRYTRLMPAQPSSTQTTNMSAPSTSKFKARGISDPADQPSDTSSFIAQQNLHKRLPTWTKVPKDEIQSVDINNDTLLMNLRKEMRGQLIRWVKASTAGFAETKITTTHPHQGIPIRPCQGEMSIVLVRVDIEMMRGHSVGVGW